MKYYLQKHSYNQKWYTLATSKSLSYLKGEPLRKWRSREIYFAKEYRIIDESGNVVFTKSFEAFEHVNGNICKTLRGNNHE